MPHSVVNLLYWFTVYFIALTGLPGIWLAYCRAAWWWRVAPLLLILAGLVAVPASDLVLFTLTRALATSLPVIAVAAWRRARAGQLPRIQFTLNELLIGSVALAIALAILACMLRQPVNLPSAWIVLGLAIGCLDLLVATATLGARVRWWWVLLIVVIVASTALPIESQLAWPLHDQLPYSGTIMDYTQVEPAYRWLGPASSLLSGEFLAQVLCSSSRYVFPGEMLLLVICLGWRLARSKRPAEVADADLAPRRLSRGFGRAAVSAGGWLVALLPALLVWHNMPAPGILPPPVRSGPNAYYRLTGLSRKITITSSPLVRWSELYREEALAALPSDELQRFVQQNAPVFDEVHQLVWQPSWMPVEDNDLLPNHDALMSLATYLRVHIRGLAQGDKPADAEPLLLDQLRLGRSAGYSPYAVFEGVAHAIELRGVSDAARHLDLIPAARIPDWLEKLRTIENDRQDAAAIGETGRQALRVFYGWPFQLQEALYRLAGLPPLEVGNPDTFVRRNLALLRLLQCELAIRAYQAQHGREPPSLDALVPQWLSAVPTDPYGGEKLNYQSTDAGHLLYSVGPNLVDDGGVYVETPDLHDEGDLFLDSYLDEK